LEPISVNKLDAKFREGILARMEGEDLKRCLGCGTCSAGCLVREVDKNYNPRQIARRVLLGMKDYFKEKPEIPYSCNLCELCQKTCPYGVNIGELCLVLRELLVEAGIGPLPAHKVINDDVEWALSPTFALSLPDPDAAKCKRAFFTGCNLPAYSPSLTMATYDYLREKLPGTGIILRCCGAPYHGLGEHSLFKETMGGLEHEMSKLGASELIVPCPDCYRTLKRATPSFELKTLYEVLVEVGVPQLLQDGHATFSLHDSCTARWEANFQDSVRELVKLSGHEIEELPHSRELTLCCGQGGLILPLNPMRVFSLTKERVAEAHFDMLAYCAVCRETLSVHKPSLHVLDLLFNPNWEKDMRKPPNKPSVRKDNQSLLKSLLMERGRTA